VIDMSEAPLFWRDATAENDFCPAHGLDSSADLPPDRAAKTGGGHHFVHGSVSSYGEA